MALFLHGVAAPGPAPQAPAHHIFAMGGFMALASPAPDTTDTPEAMAEIALRHNDILAAWCRIGPVLPLRFGTVFSGPESLHTHLSAEGKRLSQSLRALGDAQEYVLRLRVAGDPVLPEEPADSGRAFLARGRAARDLRRDLGDRRMALARQLLSEVAPLARQTSQAAAPRADRLLDAALLIDRPKAADLPDLTARHRETARALGLDLTLTGPWPAYGFTPEAVNVG
ncbi:GvpL/GvpF family gas vesicle protein [Rhodobacter sp. KR11]|jgi:hypothetical protein|uniref:GvpL/GvpF family gas vesicle protein n=1 Tax=Rhodobacter sp. KR11 TaxID=2974588 RepID=UPI002223B4D3|nr:GvpL/GvpF family gas vesicle protein [Rhodobacter sp. KR11]MCW1917400.1 GvpL/GvpF family gas vesicle protein [Rhodobacter sp. KR11]